MSTEQIQSPEWKALVATARDAVAGWLDTMKLTPAEWLHILGADHVAFTEYPGWDVDDFKTNFAQHVLDEPPMPEELAESIRIDYAAAVDEEQRIDDAGERIWRVAELAWADAVDQAEDELAAD